MSRKKNPSREKPQKWESSKTDKDITSREYNNIITSKRISRTVRRGRKRTVG